MSVQHNKAMYRRYNDRCNAHDFHTLGEFVAEDVRVNGQSQGLERYIQGLSDVVAAFPDYHWRLDQLLAEEEWIFARFTDSGTHRGPFLGVAPTGRSVSTFELAVYRLIDGKIAEVWVTADNLTILRQLAGDGGPANPTEGGTVSPVSRPPQRS
jgi:aspartyl-tRNA synthetase